MISQNTVSVEASPFKSERSNDSFQLQKKEDESTPSETDFFTSILEYTPKENIFSEKKPSTAYKRLISQVDKLLSGIRKQSSENSNEKHFEIVKRQNSEIFDPTTKLTSKTKNNLGITERILKVELPFGEFEKSVEIGDNPVSLGNIKV